MEAIIQYLGNSRFEASARTHKVICDQPLNSGGEDAGMSPPEFLLTSLGTCAAYYASQYLRARSLPTGDLQVRVTAEKAVQPARLGQFHIELTLPPLEERHREGVMRAVKACLVHNTLMNSPVIEMIFQESTVPA
jgi:uncharacterized OsmC-like protein